MNKSLQHWLAASVVVGLATAVGSCTYAVVDVNVPHGVVVVGPVYFTADGCVHFVPASLFEPERFWCVRLGRAAASGATSAPGAP